MTKKPVRFSKMTLIITAASLALLSLIGSLGFKAFKSIPDTRSTTWSRSGNNLQSDKYSTLLQINKNNINRLKPAWVYHSGISGSVLSIQTNPIYSEGLLFTTSACCLIGINAKDGVQVWKLELPSPAGRRGLTYYKGNIYVPTPKGVYVVTAKTGEINKALGHGGIFGAESSVLPPIISGNQLIIANFLASVESWNIDTGKIIWRTSLEKDGVTPRLWSGLSYDEENKLVFVVTSSSMNFFAKHYGDGYSTSVLAIDAIKGNVVWQFQEVKRDIWDLDMVGPPIVSELNKDGKRIPVVIAVSKTGNTILVERKTGKSIFGFEYQKAPPSDIAGETTSEQQIAISKPEPFADLYFDLENDVTHLSKSKRDYVLHKVRNSKSSKFLPTSLNYDVVMYGLNGGAEWPGAAIDTSSNTLIVPSNKYPFILRGEYFDRTPDKTKGIASKNSTYISKCAPCHGEDLTGAIDWGMGDRFNPRLTGISKKRDKGYLTSIKSFKYDHKYAKKNNPKGAGDVLEKISYNDLLQAYYLFNEIDKNIDVKNIDDGKQFYYRGTYQYLLDPDGQFGSDPPWGYITAINLNSGKVKWKIPFGEVYDKQTQRTYQGDVNVGGVMVAGGGIIFANGTRDSKARAFDVNTGKLLWESKLPATGSAPPMTFELDGCQYVVFTATGGARFGNYSDSTVAYRLPNCELK